MNINLTPAQYVELEVLVLALQHPKSQASAVSVEICVNATKVKYEADNVKFVLSG